MKINAMDEYGLRVIIRIAKSTTGEGLSIPQISEMEGLSAAYVAKITRSLREGGLIVSSRGHKGGYLLARPAEAISINEILKVLGGKLYDKSFCEGHAGEMKFCTNSVDCSVRSLWRLLQSVLDQLLEQITLSDMLNNEKKTMAKFQVLKKQLLDFQLQTQIETNTP
jgi:Rrf2 family transcriptional regulator, iron-sulfur cluster assembly transcription factor